MANSEACDLESVVTCRKWKSVGRWRGGYKCHREAVRENAANGFLFIFHCQYVSIKIKAKGRVFLQDNPFLENISFRDRIVLAKEVCNANLREVN